MKRREVLAAATAVTVTFIGSDASAQSGPVTPAIKRAISGATVASCTVLKAIDARLSEEAARSLSMSKAEVNAEVTAMMAALKRRTVVADAFAAAYKASSVAMARQAAVTAVEVVLAGCILQQNFVCIGSVYGVKLVAGSTDAAIQLYNAKSPEGQTDVAIAFATDRIGLFKDMAGDLKPRGYHEAAKEALTKLSKAGLDLSVAGATLAKSKGDLDAAVAALAKMEAGFAPALVNEASTRQFRRENFEAQRWIVQLLLSSYADSDCKIRDVSIPIRKP